MDMKPNIELHIEELVLHGFSPLQRHTIADALGSELAARLADRGVAAKEEISIDRLDAGTVALPRGPAATGRAIGEAIHSTVGPVNREANR
jgi:hypothetical protein